MSDDRYIPRRIGNAWVVIDTTDGHQTLCRTSEQAYERAKFYSCVIRRAEQKRAMEEAIFQRLLAERMALGVSPADLVRPSPAIEQLTTA